MKALACARSELDSMSLRKAMAVLMGDETFLRLVEEGADWVLERGGGGDHDLEIAESFQKIEARQKRRS